MPDYKCLVTRWSSAKKTRIYQKSALVRLNSLSARIFSLPRLVSDFPRFLSLIFRCTTMVERAVTWQHHASLDRQLIFVIVLVSVIVFLLIIFDPKIMRHFFFVLLHIFSTLPLVTPFYRNVCFFFFGHNNLTDNCNNKNVKTKTN